MGRKGRGIGPEAHVGSNANYNQYQRHKSCESSTNDFHTRRRSWRKAMLFIRRDACPVHGPNFCPPSRDHTRPRTSDNLLRFGVASRKVLLPAAEEKRHACQLKFTGMLISTQVTASHIPLLLISTQVQASHIPLLPHIRTCSYVKKRSCEPVYTKQTPLLWPTTLVSNIFFSLPRNF